MTPVMAPAFRRNLVFSSLGERAASPTIARLMAMALGNPDLLSLAAGFTDNRTLPVVEVAEAVAALARRTGEPEYLQYGTNMGRPRLRQLLGEHLRRWEPSLDPADSASRVFITNGSQQALYLAVQVLCDPGDIMLVDRPTYFVFLEMLVGLGVTARSLPVDADGSSSLEGVRGLLDRMERTGEIERIKAVYFVSYFSNPSGRCLSVDEKTDLARALKERGLLPPVIEDAAYRDLYFADRPPAPGVVGLPDWSDFPCLYLSTLTKTFATGLKVGYGYCTDSEWLARMLHAKGHHDFGSANFNQAVLEEVLAGPAFERHLARIRPVYERKMQVLHETLEAENLRGCGWHWARPAGGLYLWLEAPPQLETGMDSVFCRRCIEGGVLYVPGELCFGDAPRRNCVRLSYGVLDESRLREAGRRFAAAAREAAGTKTSLD
ncbi:MAG: GntR family transcriptional regulator [Verrucomicrobia bacterium RIFCSPLOWO2_12_FULL_64_8]|nr:MAG: GntR family transcriptional regulator [Verrucomicrobia bacterium RIFCSPLOWO2_12_FULL_64_8]